jgi:hypothetical protein
MMDQGLLDEAVSAADQHLNALQTVGHNKHVLNIKKKKLHSGTVSA